MDTENIPVQPTINMGIVGHVDHGKTSITKILSGKWTDTHSEEKKRGITIKLGYTNFVIYSDGKEYSLKESDSFKPVRKISIVDAPGHESFMATMISGAAIMDYALLVIAANEKCPQPQTIEHLKTLEISGIEKVIVIQNKVDLVTKDSAIENYRQIKAFLKGTIAENSPIIPFSAQYGSNVNVLLNKIYNYFGIIKRDEKDLHPLMHIIRSFDINKPGDDFRKLKGGVIGGAITKGILKIGDEIEIKPGLQIVRDGRVTFKPVIAKVCAIRSDSENLSTAGPGGSIAIMTGLDPTVTKTDSLVGQMASIKGYLPEPLMTLKFKNFFFDKVITSSKDYDVKSFVQNEPLMLIVNSLTTVGSVFKANPNSTEVKLRKPVMAFEGDRVVVFKRFDNNKWRIIGHGLIE